LFFTPCREVSGDEGSRHTSRTRGRTMSSSSYFFTFLNALPIIMVATEKDLQALGALPLLFYDITPSHDTASTHTSPLEIPVWWRRAVLPSLPWVVCFLSFFQHAGTTRARTGADWHTHTHTGSRAKKNFRFCEDHFAIPPLGGLFFLSALLLVARPRASGPLGALHSSPALDVRSI
jgi:hypothetical protein